MWKEPGLGSCLGKNGSSELQRVGLVLGQPVSQVMLLNVGGHKLVKGKVLAVP